MNRDGSVRRILRFGGDRYRNVKLSKNGIVMTLLVHRLVAFAWLGEPPSSDCEVCHNDGDTHNNDVSNLRWDTHKSNVDDAIEHGVYRSGNVKRVVRDDGIEFDSVADAARSVNRTRKAVCNHLAGRSKHAGGHTFAYLE